MAKAEPNSTTWKAVQAFIKSEKEDAISRLIADEKPEQQRGIIQALSRLDKLADEEPELIVRDTYQS